MPTPSATYEPRCPAQRVLHQIVFEHFETFRAQAASLRDGEGLPRFVEQEFRDFLALRPPIAEDRLRIDCDGAVWLTLRHLWADGTTHLKFDPVELLERLAVLTPRPRINLVLYYGVLAPRAPWRAEIVASAVSQEAEGAAATELRTPDDERSDRRSPRRPGAYLWADLMRRTFGFEVLECPRCGGRLRLLALIEHADTVKRILRHLGLPMDLPASQPARAPPHRVQPADLRWEDGPLAVDATY